jgi:hypothetical protein
MRAPRQTLRRGLPDEPNRSISAFQLRSAATEFAIGILAASVARAFSSCIACGTNILRLVKSHYQRSVNPRTDVVVKTSADSIVRPHAGNDGPSD